MPTGQCRNRYRACPSVSLRSHEGDVEVVGAARCHQQPVPPAPVLDAAAAALSWKARDEQPGGALGERLDRRAQAERLADAGGNAVRTNDEVRCDLLAGSADRQPAFWCCRHTDGLGGHLYARRGRSHGHRPVQVGSQDGVDADTLNVPAESPA